MPYLDSFEISVSGTPILDGDTPLALAHDELKATVAWSNGRLIVADVWHDRQGTIEGTPMGKLIADAIRKDFEDEAGQRFLFTNYCDALEEEAA